MGTIAKIQLETVFYFALMVLGVVTLIISLGYGFGSLERPGQGLYPCLVSTLILVFSTILFILKCKSKKSNSLFNLESAKTYILIFITLCLWIVVMPLLGYGIVTLLATFALCKIMKLEGWWKPFAVSISTALFIYLLFGYILYSDLPKGIWGS